MHRREAIREKVVAALITDVSLVTGRVFKARVYPMDAQALPGICVFVNDESAALGTTAGQPRTSERVLALSVQLFVKGSPDISAALAEISAQVEISLGNLAMEPRPLDELALDIFLSGYEESLNGNQADRAQGKKTGVGDLTYQILYDVPENNPEAQTE